MCVRLLLLMTDDLTPVTVLITCERNSWAHFSSFRKTCFCSLLVESDKGSTDSEVRKILTLHIPITEYDTLGSESDTNSQRAAVAAAHHQHLAASSSVSSSAAGGGGASCGGGAQVPSSSSSGPQNAASQSQKYRSQRGIFQST